jgi:hypothetical protein
MQLRVENMSLFQPDTELVELLVTEAILLRLAHLDLLLDRH